MAARMRVAEEDRARGRAKRIQFDKSLAERKCSPRDCSVQSFSKHFMSGSLTAGVDMDGMSLGHIGKLSQCIVNTACSEMLINCIDATKSIILSAFLIDVSIMLELMLSR